MNVGDFIRQHYLHFNAASLVAAAEAYNTHIEAGGSMVVCLAGAMSTAELGLSLAEMIREGKVHAISCTGANLEEDVFGLVARRSYAAIPDWRNLSRDQEQNLHDERMNRVTDTCIPATAITLIEEAMFEQWESAERSSQEIRWFPHEPLYRLLRSGTLARHYQIDPKNSWLVAAAEANLPLIVPGWEDSTLGNSYAAKLLAGELRSPHLVKTGIEYMIEFARWYAASARPIHVPSRTECDRARTLGSVGFFQIGGGIAGDFPVCVVPLLRQCLQRTDTPQWGYYCQVSDAPTSYGGYSGAVPNEKITWGKLSADTPAFVVESDATIVVPLIFASVLGW
ncbi:MAG: deoxyhypusine synthase family protein [Phycisphaerales bacterium]|nr:deoxyhypusine synthase family protein [Phycisphaerales bacterium]